MTSIGKYRSRVKDFGQLSEVLRRNSNKKVQLNIKKKKESNEKKGGALFF